MATRRCSASARHVVDDLLTLIEAIGVARDSDRSLMKLGPEPLDLTTLPEAVQVLFEKPVVAIHLGAGNVTKQWPLAYFAALVELLAERDGVNILLVGGPDEQELATTLLAGVRQTACVGSMVGQTGLAALPKLLAACALYIGNDSGPKHIAAAIGVPTIGIHSGVVDAREWGPIGRRAVALRRDMTCSPCYLANAEDCPRALACLQLLEPSVVHQTAELLLARAVAPVGVGSAAAVDVGRLAAEVPAGAGLDDGADEDDADVEMSSAGADGDVAVARAPAWRKGGR